jgi:hypothetical protein
MLLSGEDPPVGIVHIGIEFPEAATLEPNLLKKPLLCAALTGMVVPTLSHLDPTAR